MTDDKDNIIHFPKVDAFEAERRARGVSDEMMQYLRPYKLVGHQCVRCTSMEDWDKVFHERYTVADQTGADPWRVAETKIGASWVSTVFLGLDHRLMPSGPPLLFETMVFGGAEDEYQERCSTWEEALVMHAQALDRLRKHLRVIK